MNRRFVLRERQHFNSLLAFLNANWEAMAARGKFMGVVCSEYREKRSLEQNALMWVWLTQVEKQAWIAGRQYDAETWNEHAKREFLPDRTNGGKDKWRILPSGERLLAISTTDLDVTEMTLYLSALDAFIATELGVQISEREF